MSLTRVLRHGARLCAAGALWAAAAGVLGAASPASAQGVVGPDVTYQDINGVQSYGAVGGIQGYALGSATCNIGNQNLLWTSSNTPILAMNAYRLHDGRLMQIGQGWGKTACCAAATSGCGGSCNGAGGSVLGAGCRDVYSAGWNGGQSRLGPRSSVNAFTGAMASAPGGSGNAIFKRLQIATADLSVANFPGALYFVEGEYIASDDAPAGNALNNASHRRVTVGAAAALNLAGSTQIGIPAIQAWRDHGNGVGVPDTSVQIVTADVPSEGRFYVAGKARDLGAGQWRYEYAVFNLNSHRSGGSFSVPIPAGVMVTGVGYNGVVYHSGEPYANVDWVSGVTPTSVEWRSPQTFEQNQNTNALRWGTMYNFWFDTNTAPADAPGDLVRLGLFRPGTVPSITIAGMPVPGSLPCLVDFDGDGTVTVGDFLAFLTSYSLAEARADLDGDGDVDIADFLEFLNLYSDGCA